MLLPYEAIGIGVGVILGVWALLQAETAAGRVLVIALMIAIFFLPVVWSGRGGHIARLIAWMLFGIGCYIFIKVRGVPLR